MAIHKPMEALPSKRDLERPGTSKTTVRCSMALLRAAERFEINFSEVAREAVAAEVYRRASAEMRSRQTRHENEYPAGVPQSGPEKGVA
jgi:hypothetical protein